MQLWGAVLEHGAFQQPLVKGCRRGSPDAFGVAEAERGGKHRGVQL